MATEVTSAASEPRGTGEKGLKTNALGLVSTTVIGVASTAPAYSLAATLGLVAAAVGLYSPGIMLLAFVPMLFIAAAYFYLNRADPDCGTTFTWVTRAMGPKTGWMAGWGILMTDLIVMPNLAGIAAQYTFSLFGADGPANNPHWQLLLGIVWIVAMTAICYIGIELSAETQVGLLSYEIAVLVLFSCVALFKAYFRHPAGRITPHIGWLNPFGSGSSSALATAILLAIFIYWGWDTAVTVNEEAKDKKRTPGRAAILSTIILVAIYVLVTTAAQSLHGADFLGKNPTDVLNAMGKDVLGSPWNKLLIIAVLTSAAASTQTTILPAARSALSMAVHKAVPKKFADIHPRYLTPGFATLFLGGLSIAWYVFLTLVSNNVLKDSILALGFGIAFYYALTGYACVVYYRKHLFSSAKNFFLIFLAPLAGALFLTWAFIKSLFVYSNPSQSSSGAWWKFIDFDFKVGNFHYYAHGVGSVLVIGVGLLLLGLPLMALWWVGHKEFFQHEREVAETVDGEAPPLTEGVDKELLRDA